jgi:hypothetical protein
MPNQAGTLELLARELGYALSPLAQYLTADEVRTLFAELGVQFPPELLNHSGFTSALNTGAAAATAISQVLTQLSTAITNGDAGAILQYGLKLLSDIPPVIDAIKAIAVELNKLANESEMPPQVSAFAAALPTTLIDFLLVRYVELRLPGLTSALVLTGVIERPFDPGDPNDPTKPPYIARSLHLKRLSTLLRSPLDQIAEVYGWNGSGFDGHLVVAHFQQFLAALNVWSVAQPPPPAVPTVVDSWPFRLETDTSGVRLTFKMSVEDGFDLTLPISSQWAMHLVSSGQFAAGTEARITSPTTVVFVPPSNGTLNAEVKAEFVGSPVAPETALTLLGQTGASRLEAASLRVAFGLQATWDVNQQQAIGALLVQAAISGGKVIIDTGSGGGLLAQLLSNLRAEATFDLRATWSPATGLRLEGGAGIEIRIPVSVTLGPVTLQSLYLRSALGTDGDIPFEVSSGLDVTLGPLTITVDRIGIEGLLSFPNGGGGNLGPADFSIGFKPPNGLGLAVEAGPISGGGFVQRSPGPPERFAGALALKLTSFAVVAFGLFERTPSGQIAFVMVLGIRFSPGFQLGFGFALNGVGGLVAINRRADADALRERLVSGTAGNVLFAEDPIRDAPTLLGDLRALFPSADGIVVVGPTLQLTWLALARFDLALVIELPGPTRIILLGVARFQVGGESGAPAIVQIRFDILGVLDFVKRLVSFDAALVNSRLLQIFHLTGTAAFRLSTAERPYVLLTIGGFHPAFNPEPAVLPPIARVGLTFEMNVGARLWLRLEAYLALTSNTFQVGAALEVGVEVGPLNALGFLSFDALIQFKPFYFTIRFSAGFCVRWGSFTLAGVRATGTLSGPGPLVLSASFTLEILFFEISWDGSFRLGEEDQAPPETVDSLVQALGPELAVVGNLQATASEDREVATAAKLTATCAVVPPYGQLTWSQKRAPLNVALERFEGVPLKAPQAVVVEAQGATGISEDWFSPGTFINLSQSEGLNRSGFERLQAGIQFGFGYQVSETVSHDIEVKTIRLPELPKSPEQDGLQLLLPLFSQLFMSAIYGRTAPGAALSKPPLIGVSDELWQVQAANGTVMATGLKQTDAHQRARAIGGTALPMGDAKGALDLGGS